LGRAGPGTHQPPRVFLAITLDLIVDLKSAGAKKNAIFLYLHGSIDPESNREPAVFLVSVYWEQVRTIATSLFFL
jgi:hypothetical protein